MVGGGNSAAQLLAAMHDGTIDTAMAALGSPDYQLARREPGQPRPRTFAGGSATNATFTAGGSLSFAGGGGGGGTGTTHVMRHDHGSDEPCGPTCPGLIPPGGSAGWVP